MISDDDILERLLDDAIDTFPLLDTVYERIVYQKSSDTYLYWGEYDKYNNGWYTINENNMELIDRSSVIMFKEYKLSINSVIAYSSQSPLRNGFRSNDDVFNMLKCIQDNNYSLPVIEEWKLGIVFK